MSMLYLCSWETVKVYVLQHHKYISWILTPVLLYVGGGLVKLATCSKYQVENWRFGKIPKPSFIWPCYNCSSLNLLGTYPLGGGQGMKDNFLRMWTSTTWCQDVHITTFPKPCLTLYCKQWTEGWEGQCWLCTTVQKQQNFGSIIMVLIIIQHSGSLR